jgi:bifunctional oligoribonuclease and PAP phosphatase NrnA
MPIDWTPFVELVSRYQRFLLTTHVRPDGDGIGSILGLGETLQQMGKEVRLVLPSSFPPRYRFLDPEHRIEIFSKPGDAWRNTDAVIVMDTGTWNQLGEFGPFLRGLSAAKVVIDHHQTQDDLGALRLVDAGAEATGRLCFEAIQGLGQPLTERAANALLVAVGMDTGWFQHGNTTAATFALVSALVQAGAQPSFTSDQLFKNNPLPRLKLTGLVLERLQVTSGGLVAHTEIRLADYAATGATPPDSEDLVNYTLSVAGVEVGLLFVEQPKGGVKVSFRSRAIVDVARLAEQFAGGGHRRASGAMIQSSLPEVRSRVLEAVASALGGS